MQINKPTYPNIAAELSRYGLKVKELADYIDTTTQNLYAKLNGKTAFSLNDMQKVQEFFKVKCGVDFTLDYLFQDNDN